jgi:hypothetical protein
MLPREELRRVTDELLDAHYRADKLAKPDSKGDKN